MERGDLLAALRRDSDAFAAACDRARPDALVPGCPGWTVADLVWHLAEVHDFWGTIVARRMLDPSDYLEPARPDDSELIARFRAGASQLQRTLADTEPATPVWTWTADTTAAWVVRRMAHETAIHAGDAQRAAGGPAAIEPLLASDGIDELLHWFTGSHAEGSQPVAGTVHIHCTDVPGEWLVVEQPSGAFTVTRQHAKGDCALRGPASDVLLALWRRAPLTSIDVVGDPAVAARFVARSRLT